MLPNRLSHSRSKTLFTKNLVLHCARFFHLLRKLFFIYKHRLVLHIRHTRAVLHLLRKQFFIYGHLAVLHLLR